MTTRHVLSVGQCAPDQASISRFLQSHFDVAITPVPTGPDAIAALRGGHYDLVLINRKLDIDYSDGIDIIRTLKADAELGQVPAMLITNYAEHQENAVSAGAEYGFGKDDLRRSDVVTRLEKFLG